MTLFVSQIRIYFVVLDFSLLKSKYHEILKCLPKDFHQSLQKLQDKFSDDQICTILNCPSSPTANKMIFDCLIDNMKCREDLLDLCDQLDRLTDISPNLKHIMTELRKGCLSNVCFCITNIYLPLSLSTVVLNSRG